MCTQNSPVLTSEVHPLIFYTLEKSPIYDTAYTEKQLKINPQSGAFRDIKK